MTAQQLELVESTNSCAAVAEHLGVETVAESAAPATAAEKCCPRCGSTESWGRGSWCPDCGYYPGLMTLDEGTVPPRAKAPPTSGAATYAEMLKAIPLWVPILLAGIIAVLGMSFYVRWTLPQEGPKRFYWTIGQLCIGFVAMAAAQVFVFFSAIPTSDHFAPFDLFLKPIAIWKPALRKMSRWPWPLWQAAWGLTAMVCAVTMIGGVRYGAIFETKTKSAGLPAPQATRSWFSSENSSTPTASRSIFSSARKTSGSKTRSKIKTAKKPSA